MICKMKKRVVSTSSTENERDGRGTNMRMRMEVFVGLLRRWSGSPLILGEEIDPVTVITITIHGLSTRM